MAKIQNYGIRFPINVTSEDRTLFDLNHTRAEEVKSEIMHIVFTPKVQRVRQPNFGTSLIQYIFEPNDGQSWGDIVTEIKETVKTWIPDCKVENIEVAEMDNGLGLGVKIRYRLSEIDGSTQTYELITKL